MGGANCGERPLCGGLASWCTLPLCATAFEEPRAKRYAARRKADKQELAGFGVDTLSEFTMAEIPSYYRLRSEVNLSAQQMIRVRNNDLTCPNEPRRGATVVQSTAKGSYSALHLCGLLLDCLLKLS